MLKKLYNFFFKKWQGIMIPGESGRHGTIDTGTCRRMKAVRFLADAGYTVSSVDYSRRFIYVHPPRG